MLAHIDAVLATVAQPDRRESDPSPAVSATTASISTLVDGCGWS